MIADIDGGYVRRHFWTLAELGDAVGTTTDRVEALIAAGCAPGPSYVAAANGWWSALDRNARPMPEGVRWYSRGAAWGLRRALLIIRSGVSEERAAAILADAFRQEFGLAVQETDGADLAYPACFVGDAIDMAAVHDAAQGEWDAWIEGAYGVCLRVFTGRGCVVKETLGAMLKSSLDRGDYDVGELLLKAEPLADIMLPFAPWQRGAGTPGRTIDRLLLEAGLGSDRPYDRL